MGREQAMEISGNVTALLIALISGILMAIQGSLNTALSKTIGLIETTFLVHLIGSLVMLALLLGFRLGNINIQTWTQAPWYTYLGGVLGVGIIYLVAASIPRIGVANATTAIIVGQVLMAILIDHYGAFNLERIPCGWNQIVGLLLLAAGAKLLLK